MNIKLKNNLKTCALLIAVTFTSSNLFAKKDITVTVEVCGRAESASDENSGTNVQVKVNCNKLFPDEVCYTYLRTRDIKEAFNPGDSIFTKTEVNDRVVINLPSGQQFSGVVINYFENFYLQNFIMEYIFVLNTNQN